MMTEEERMGLKQSEAFFNFGSDGEELGGDLEDALEPPPRTNGSASVLTHKMESLTMTPPSALPPHHMAAASPHGPLTVQQLVLLSPQEARLILGTMHLT